MTTIVEDRNGISHLLVIAPNGRDEKGQVCIAGEIWDQQIGPLLLRVYDHLTSLAEIRSGESVPMPANADQAAAMQLLGYRWLVDNAPERLSNAVTAREDEIKTAIEIEKRLCAALGKRWEPSGMSVETLVDEAIERLAVRKPATLKLFRQGFDWQGTPIEAETLMLVAKRSTAPGQEFDHAEKHKDGSVTSFRFTIEDDPLA